MLLTKNFIFFSESVSVLRKWSANLPGVAMTTCGLCERAIACFIISERDVVYNNNNNNKQ